jgi:hypothetical protein
MPININQFQSLIQSLPTRRQCFSIRRANFQNVENAFPWVIAMNNGLFLNQGVIQLSRNDLFNHGNIDREKILKIIYWGYPRGMRGNHLTNILNNVDQIVEELNRLYLINNLNLNDYISFHQWSVGITGLGSSTYTKLLYFCNIYFNSNHSMILDERIIRNFNNNVFIEFANLSPITNYQFHNYYIEYLETLNNLSLQMNTNEENIEQFLFIFGNNLN